MMSAVDAVDGEGRSVSSAACGGGGEAWDDEKLIRRAGNGLKY